MFENRLNVELSGTVYFEFSVIRRSSVHPIVMLFAEYLKLEVANGHWSTMDEVKNASLNAIFSLIAQDMVTFSMSALGRHFCRMRS